MIQIYTDGSCNLQTRAGGSAFIVIKDEEIVYQRQFSFKNTTNNFCELFATLQGIRYILNNNILECQIFSDSKYVVNGINDWMEKWSNNNWRGSVGHEVANLEMWQNVFILWGVAKSLSNVSIQYVKAHSTDNNNKFVDKLAKEASKQIQDANRDNQK
jgi:ribonuclease HI